MAHLIQPCCSQRHLSELRRILRKNGTAQFEGYGDLSLTELLPPLVNHYNGVKMLIAAPTLPDQAANIIRLCMRKEWTLMDGSGKIPVITQLTIVADFSPEQSPTASLWKKTNPFGERLTLIDVRQEDTAILLPDFAITGPVNMRYGHHFVATATTEPEKVRALWEKYRNPEKPAADATGAVAKEEAMAEKAAEAKPARKRVPRKRKKADGTSAGSTGNK